MGRYQKLTSLLMRAADWLRGMILGVKRESGSRDLGLLDFERGVGPVSLRFMRFYLVDMSIFLK